MKLSLLILSILLLSSCTQYRYDIAYEKCNGGTGSIQYSSFNNEPFIRTYKEAVPILSDSRLEEIRILNVCSFSYTKIPLD